MLDPNLSVSHVRITKLHVIVNTLYFTKVRARVTDSMGLLFHDSLYQETTPKTDSA